MQLNTKALSILCTSDPVISCAHPSPFLFAPPELLHAEWSPDGLQQDEVEQEDEEGECAGEYTSQVWS